MRIDIEALARVRAPIMWKRRSRGTRAQWQMGTNLDFNKHYGG